MIRGGRNLKGLCATWGLIAVIAEAAVIQCIAADIPAESHQVVIEYIKEDEPQKAAVNMPARTHDIITGRIFSDQEADQLQRIAMAEAGNQTEDGMWLVMSVVINREQSEDFPDTIYKVIHQSGAFSAVSNGSFDKAEPSDECIKAYERICSGDVAQEVIAFETKSSDVLDKYFKLAFTHKDHKFYTKK